MKQKKRRIQWNFKAPEDLLARLSRAAEISDRPASQIAREAISEKLDELAERFPEINETPKREQTVAA